MSLALTSHIACVAELIVSQLSLPLQYIYEVYDFTLRINKLASNDILQTENKN